MDSEPRPPQEKNLDSSKLSALLDELLKESSQYNCDCLDLKEQIFQVVIDWFNDKSSELEEDFKDFYPQTHPAKQELLERMRPVLPLDRIHVEGTELEFRRTKIIDHWVGEIYNRLLSKVFKEGRS